MSEIQKIERVVQQAAWRERGHRAWTGAWHGLLAGAAFWLLALAVFKVAPLPLETLNWAGLASLCFIPIGALARAWRSQSRLQTARWVDRRQSLKERLSTALEMVQTSTEGEWQRLVVTDAAQHAEKVDVKQLIRWQLPRASRWALVVLVVGAGLGWVPEYRSKAYLQKQIDAQVIRETGKNLADLAHYQLKTQPPVLPPVKEKLESLADLGEHMAEAKLTRNEALRDLASATEKLKMEARELAQNPAMKRLEQASRTRSTSPSHNARESAALQKKIEDLQKSLGEKGTNIDKLNDMQKDLEKIKEAAAAMANSANSNDAAMKEQLNQSLSSLQQKAAEMGLSLPNLDKALEALAADQAELVMKQLLETDKNLEKLKEMAQTLQQLQKSKDPVVGKDLAEKLKKGQAKSAQETLEAMAKKLATAKATPEEMRKILEEVQKAREPAADYGDLAEKLKEAVEKMEKGQQAEAGKKLEEAAKELEKLMDEMGDLEAMKAALEALGRAQMAVGNGQMGNGKIARPGKGNGPNKGGRGFGNWTDEEGWQEIPEMSELWDNGEDDRGELDPRSNKDRGDGQLADNLDPTRLRGQMNPGGPMPSITLRGVSIKGQSRIAIDEAVMGAQSDAQNALSQEQIPKAYQNAVKDYFDDLKK